MASAELWKKALETLPEDDRQAIVALQLGSSKRSIVAEVLKGAQTKRDVVLEKRWKYKKNDGSIVIVRDVFEKIIHWVARYASAVDVVSNVEPLYVSPAWAVVRFLLQVSLD